MLRLPYVNQLLLPVVNSEMEGVFSTSVGLGTSAVSIVLCKYVHLATIDYWEGYYCASPMYRTLLLTFLKFGNIINFTVMFGCRTKLSYARMMLYTALKERNKNVKGQKSPQLSQSSCKYVHPATMDYVTMMNKTCVLLC